MNTATEVREKLEFLASHLRRAEDACDRAQDSMDGSDQSNWPIDYVAKQIDQIQHHLSSIRLAGDELTRLVVSQINEYLLAARKKSSATS